jgi:RND family efflux transporter MFP subunit
MPADEIETRILLINERVLTASVNDIEHIESQSLDGVGVIRIFFQPGAKIAEAQAQVTATWQTLLKIMPPGITPSYIVRYAAEASIQVNEAAVQRFTDLQGFQKITAPFPGVITARNVDPGDLISADSPSMTKELFHLMRTDILRVFVNVPQVFATGIRVGQDAAVFRREDPLKQFAGKVTRTADALDPNTRTLLTEVQVPNPDGALRPGMYLQVKFLFTREFAPVLVPAAAVVTRTDGPMLALLDGNQTVRYRKVQLGRDYGAEVEVLAGLQGGETVIVRPGDALPEGTAVQPVAPSEPSPRS